MSLKWLQWTETLWAKNNRIFFHTIDESTDKSSSTSKSNVIITRLGLSLRAIIVSRAEQIDFDYAAERTYFDSHFPSRERRQEDAFNVNSLFIPSRCISTIHFSSILNHVFDFLMSSFHCHNLRVGESFLLFLFFPTWNIQIVNGSNFWSFTQKHWAS